MAKERNVIEIDGVFTIIDDYNWGLERSLNEERLREVIINDELFEKLVEDFKSMKDTDRFSAQVVKVTVEKSVRYVISLGHFIYSHHYTYFPNLDYWYKSTINQEFFEDVVQPFQKKRNRKPWDGITRIK